MNPVDNPYAPGAGTPPPELAGRDSLRDLVGIALKRIRTRKFSKSVLMLGLRGVGKTVLLDRMHDDAETDGIHTLRVEAPEDRSLPAILAPELRIALLRLSGMARAKDLATRALRGLAGFARGMKIKYHDIEVGLDHAPEPGLADNGDLTQDLQALLVVSGEAALAGNTALAVFVDELQYVKEDQLAALITALHRCAQKQLPVVMVGAGLPQLRAQTGKAKSYAERLFDFPTIGPLGAEDARQAITKPAERLGIVFAEAALNRIIAETGGYPYFLQEWGKHAWDAASKSPITKADVEQASVTAVAALDESFFRVRFDRCTPQERVYLRAMAEKGPGPHRSGDIADLLGRHVTSLGPIRNKLIAKGMIWSPEHGDTAFTVPLFDQFMRRIMHDNSWKPGKH